MRILLLSLFASLFFLPFAQAKTQAKSKIQVGLCFDDSSAVRWNVEKFFITKKIEEYGGTVYTEFAAGNPDLQKIHIKQMIDRKVDVIIIVASDGEKIAETVRLANKKKIKVIAYDRMIPNCHLEYYISFDNVEVGRLMAKKALETAPDANFVLLGGPEKDNNSVLIHDGVTNELQSKVNIVKDVYLKEWTKEEAYSTMVALLKSNPEIDAIVAANDVIAEGAIKAFKESGKTAKVITGQDAELEALERIENGEQTMTVYKPIKNLAKICGERAVEIASAHTANVTRDVQTINNGSEDVPAMLLPAILVDKSNTSVIRHEIESYSKYY